MEKNKKLLEEWNKEIKDYKKLNIKEAKALYNKMINCEDDNTKKELRNQLIIETLYVVVNFIERSGVLYLNGCSYDTSDIISICNETWIEKIDSGALLKVKSFAKIFDSDYYKSISDKMDISLKMCSGSIYIITLFSLYLERKINDLNYDYTQFIEYLIEIYRKKGDLFYLSINFTEEMIANYCELFDGIIESLELDIDNVEISKKKLINFRNVLISNGLDYIRKNPEDLVQEDIAEQIICEQSRKVVKEMLYSDEQVSKKEYVTSDGITNREKEILKLRFGFADGCNHTLEYIANMYNLSRDRIRQIEAKAIRKLRNPSRVKKFEDLL